MIVAEGTGDTITHADRIQLQWGRNLIVAEGAARRTIMR